MEKVFAKTFLVIIIRFHPGLSFMFLESRSLLLLTFTLDYNYYVYGCVMCFIKKKKKKAEIKETSNSFIR